jgi:hypothetical protein
LMRSILRSNRQNSIFYAGCRNYFVHPPPRGSPKLYQWALLVTPEGTVEERASKVIYASR